MITKNVYLILCFWMVALNAKAINSTDEPCNEGKDSIKTQQIKIIPSVFKDKAAVSFSSLRNEVDNILISDENGKTLQHYLVSVKKGNNVLPVIELNLLHPATYKVTVISPNAIQKEASFIKF